MFVKELLSNCDKSPVFKYFMLPIKKSDQKLLVDLEQNCNDKCKSVDRKIQDLQIEDAYLQMFVVNGKYWPKS